MSSIKGNSSEKFPAKKISGIIWTVRKFAPSDKSPVDLLAAPVYLYFSSRVLAASTPLADAWEREWVTPEPSPRA